MEILTGSFLQRKSMKLIVIDNFKLKIDNTQNNFSLHWTVKSLDLLAAVANEVYAAVAAEGGVFVLAAVS